MCSICSSSCGGGWFDNVGGGPIQIGRASARPVVTLVSEWRPSHAGFSASQRATALPSIGGDLSLSVRPENIMLASDSLPPGCNLFSGTATDVFFLGDHMRLSVSAFGGQIVTARIPVAVARSFTPGEVVHLACKPGDCRLLED